jgi:galactokinase
MAAAASQQDAARKAGLAGKAAEMYAQEADNLAMDGKNEDAARMYEKAAAAVGSTDATVDLFVPGRLCLFGEHSDWAGGFRRFNKEIVPGKTLVLGTPQGLSARVTRCDELVVTATSNDGTTIGPWRCSMDRGELRSEAESGSFFSYVAGVALVVLTRHRVRGLDIDQHTSTLPLRKGLSSSAAICVLAARAFSRCYDLKLTTRGEMEYAYLGELATGSACGRMDQACAFGPRPTLLTHDGDRLETEAVAAPRAPILLLIVDLGCEKDTPRMLAALQRSYPTPADDRGRRVHAWLGLRNQRRVARAVAALEAGDAERLGELMSEAQEDFDAHALPECPEEFEAPTLHAVLANPELGDLCWGGKGIGCGGEGTAQFVCKSAADRDRAAAVVAELGMWSCGIDVGGVT